MVSNPLKLLTQYPGELIAALIELIREEASACYIAGGTVRNWLIGLPSQDLDLTVPQDAFGTAKKLADKLETTFVPMDEDEDVARVVFQDVCIDFSSFREGAQTIREDLLKRDFTINGLAVAFPAHGKSWEDPGEAFEIIDPAGGQKDLQNKIIRATSAAVFLSDPLRLLRAFRFMAVFGFSIEPDTAGLISEYAHLLYLVAEERISRELDIIMAASGSAAIIKAMHENDILQEIIPELYEGVGVKQPSSHHLDVFEHCIATLERLERVQERPEKYFPGQGTALQKYLQEGRRVILLKWAALFHDLGKPNTHEIRQDRGGRITFYNHDKEGARLFDIIADRLKWGKADRDFISLFISIHMWPFHLNNARKKTGLTPKAYLRLIKTIGEEFHGLFMLAMADSLAGRGTGKPPMMEKEIAGLYQKTETFYSETIRPVLNERLLNGNDLIEIFGLRPGPVFREIFNNLDKARVEGKVHDRGQALEWVKNYLTSY